MIQAFLSRCCWRSPRRHFDLHRIDHVPPPLFPTVKQRNYQKSVSLLAFAWLSLRRATVYAHDLSWYRLLLIMSDTDFNSSRAAMPKILGMPRWLAFSLLTLLVWGAWGGVSKLASGGVDANTNQVFFTFGLLPLILFVWRSSRAKTRGEGRRIGIAWAFLTGILGGTGNIAFFHALVMGGKASIVAPVTALFPLVTVVLAVTLLHERIGTAQKMGLVLALGAIYLLSM